MKKNYGFKELHTRVVWFHGLRLILPVIFLSTALLSKAQIVPDYSVVESVDPVTLVQQVLIGQGVETSNITYTGADIGRGTFSGTSNLGLASGVILTSGRANNSVGPNNSGSKEYIANTPGDPALNQLCGGTTHDASILEFDFIPQSDIVEFRYVFGSEEYPEYANSNFNDVFGFFISGPGIYGPFPSPPAFPNGALNIALLPQTLPPVIVSINNINNGNSNNGPCENCQFYVNNGTGTTPNVNKYIQYDGFTTVLVARAAVTHCETYHIKLAVADVADGKFDSGVFLEANSFSSVGLAANVAFTHQAVDTAVEACNSASVAFKLFNRTPVAYTIDLQIDGTAENGVDYEYIPNQIVIPQGDTMATIVINPYDDGLWEDITETVTIIYNSALCGVIMDTLTVYIKDYPYYSSGTSPSQIIDCMEEKTLYAYGDGGVPPYYYLWSTGETTETITVSPAATTQYTVRISDECGSYEDQSINITVRGPTAEVCEDIPICLNESATLTVAGGTSWLWMPGGFTNNTIVVSPATTTTYTVTVFDDCGNSDVGQVTVFVDEPFADAGPDADICVGQPVTLVANDTPNGTWLWTDMQSGATYNGRTITVTPSDSRQYCVDVTDNCGNTLTDCVYVNVFQLTADAGSDLTICAGDPVDITGASSTGSGTFTWSDGSNTYSGQTITVSPTATTTYTLTVNNGCNATDQVTVNVNPLPNVTATASIGSICPDEQTMLNAGGALSYVWTSSPADPSLTGHETEAIPTVAPLVNTNYTVTGTDANGCSNSDQASIAVKERMFADFAPASSATCEGSPLDITYTGNAQNWATYLWDFDGGSSTATGQGPHQVSWSTAGPHTIRLTVQQSGCSSAEFTSTIQVNTQPQADFSASQLSGCTPVNVIFSDLSQKVAAGAAYSWNFGAAGNSAVADPSVQFTAAGKYDVSLTVTNPGGCVSQKTINAFIDAWPLPVAAFTANPPETSMKNPIITFTSSSTGDSLTYAWNTGDNNTYSSNQFVHTYADSGYYQVQLLVTNRFGCTDTYSNQIFISPRYMLRIPTAFTPNGDGLNDVFQIRGNGVKAFSISIYDRWGTQVFFSNDIKESWDGLVKGEPANTGIYVYHTYFKDENDEVSRETGYITLIN